MIWWIKAKGNSPAKGPIPILPWKRIICGSISLPLIYQLGTIVYKLYFRLYVTCIMYVQWRLRENHGPTFTPLHSLSTISGYMRISTILYILLFIIIYINTHTHYVCIFYPFIFLFVICFIVFGTNLLSKVKYSNSTATRGNRWELLRCAPNDLIKNRNCTPHIL